jgi:ABC-2 type transport system permease protein
MYRQKTKVLKKYLSFYWLYFVQYWKSRLVYKTDFLLGATSQSISMAVSLAFLTLVFTNITNLIGWSFNEMLFLAGFGGTVLFTQNMFLFNIIRLGESYILSGDMDRLLLRPLNPLFQIYADDVHDNNLPKVIANIVLMIYAASQIGLSFSLIELVYAAVSMVSGILVIASIFLLFSTTAFWTGTSRSAVWLFFRVSNFRKYPFEIFSISIQAVLVTLIPIAFASYFPASFLLGKEGFEIWKAATPVVGPIFYFVAYQFWKYGLSKYSSTGS